MFRIVLYGPDQTSATAASLAAFDRIAALDHIMSDYDESSELMRVGPEKSGSTLLVP